MARSAIAIGAWLTLVVLAGCTSLDGLSQGDGKNHAAKPAQTAQAAAGCDTSAPFTTIERMPSSDDAFAARWSSTRDLVVYNRGNDTHNDVFIGTTLLDGK